MRICLCCCMFFLNLKITLPHIQHHRESLYTFAIVHHLCLSLSPDHCIAANIRKCFHFYLLCLNLQVMTRKKSLLLELEKRISPIQSVYYHWWGCCKPIQDPLVIFPEHCYLSEIRHFNRKKPDLIICYLFTKVSHPCVRILPISPLRNY